MKKYIIIILIGISFIIKAQNTGSEVSTEDAIIILKVHNDYRNEVGIDSLIWSNELSKVAQKWANKLSKSKCRIKHSRKKGIGENIFWSSIPVKNVKEVVTNWGNEKEYYSYRDCCKGHKTLHYTQIIWEKTTEVGCGVATCKDGSQIWVCNYSPQGNFIGEKPYKK